MALVTGPNALTNLLDMIVLVTRSRMVVEAYWLPGVYGESARPFLDTCREVETQLWQIATPLLTADPQEELRQTIQTLHQQDSDPPIFLPIQALNFVTTVAKVGQKKRSEPASVFSLLKLDPLSGLDPATRELAETRLFAERALFIAQRMPDLLRWEMELFTVKTTEMPQLQQLVTNSTQLAAAVDRFSQVAAQLPTLLSTEREKLLSAVKEQEPGLRVLTKEVQQTLATGGQMADSTNRALQTLQEVVARFNSGATNPGAEPFQIQAYTTQPRRFRHCHRAGGLAPSAGWVGGIATPRTGIVSVQCLDAAGPNQREGSSRLRISEGPAVGRARLWCGARYGPDLPCVECEAVEMAHEGVSVNTFATHR